MMTSTRAYLASTAIDGTVYKVRVQTSCPVGTLCDDCDYLAQHAMDDLTLDAPVQNQTEIVRGDDGIERGHGATVRIVRHLGRDGFLTA